MDRILVVFDGQRWCIRHLYIIEHKLDLQRKVYHSDRSLGGPFGSIEETVEALQRILYGVQPKAVSSGGIQVEK